jgi:hypothetical protein
MANRKAKSARTLKAVRTKVEKERTTFHLPVDLMDRVRNAVYWTPGLTLAGMAEEALGKAIEALEKKHGGPFPKRSEELRGGRPINSIAYDNIHYRKQNNLGRHPSVGPKKVGQELGDSWAVWI